MVSVIGTFILLVEFSTGFFGTVFLSLILVLPFSKCSSFKFK